MTINRLKIRILLQDEKFLLKEHGRPYEIWYSFVIHLPFDYASALNLFVAIENETHYEFLIPP